MNRLGHAAADCQRSLQILPSHPTILDRDHRSAIGHACAVGKTADVHWLLMMNRAVGALTGTELSRATVATLRRTLFTAPGRLVHSARRLDLRLPQNWPWAVAFTTALTAIPTRC